jgi:methylthioribose-1-phosphate isomerase
MMGAISRRLNRRMPSEPSGPPSDRPAADDPSAESPPAVARRAFLRSFSRDAANAAIQAAGVAVGVQRAAGNAIGSALGGSASPAPTDRAVELGAASPPTLAATTLDGAQSPGMPTAEPSVGPAGAVTRTVVRPYRIEGDSLWIVDQRDDPGSADEIHCASLSDLTLAMRDRHVFGAPLLGELAGFGLWLAVIGVRGTTLQTKRTRIRTSGAALRTARSNVATIDWTVGRMVAAWDSAVTVTEDEAELEHAMLMAASDVSAQMRAVVAGLAAVGADAMPAASGSAFGLLTLGSSGYSTDPDGGGATAIAAALVTRGRPVRAWILETRPVEAEARATARGLAFAGAEATVVADAAAGWLLATKPIDAVIIGADRVAPGGAVTSVIGAYGLAVLARQHGVPCFAIATRSTIDREVRDSADPGVEVEPSAMVDPRDPRSATLASRVGTRGPLQDVTTPDLLSGIITESGVLRAPFDEAIARSFEID